MPYSLAFVYAVTIQDVYIFSRYFLYVASRVFIILGINKRHIKHLSVFVNRNFMVNRKFYREHQSFMEE